ncbi:MAG: tryptophan 7-halogenase [Asticcacaulis sp.]
MQDLAPDSSASRLEHIVIYGAGLAAQMTAAALAHQAPPYIRISWLKSGEAPASDMFYGSVATPISYDFNLLADVSEPQLVLNSSTAFSYGTLYQGWGGPDVSWVQAYHLPLPVLEGIPFQHYLSQQGEDALEDYIVSAMAARRGAFAHPPEAQGHALSRAEYGYQFDAASYGALFETLAAGRVEVMVGELSQAERDGETIRALHLADGRKLTGDMFVDCSGPEAALLSQTGVSFTGGRRLAALSSLVPASELGEPVRRVTARDFGWIAETPLQDAVARLIVFDPESEALALKAQGEVAAQKTELTLGAHNVAWFGNCVAIGQAAGVLEPVTPAPFIMLQRDIERLFSLLPVTTQMSVERRAFNHQYSDDYRHAGLFNRALFEGIDLPDTPYWRAARLEAVDERLAGKIEQFESRGLQVSFDLEPFTSEDWLILHYGMGRKPQRYDRVTDRASKEKVAQYLMNMRRDIDLMVKAMPRHHVYMQGFKNYLKQQAEVAS